jgi:hypothetical protein
MHERLFDLSLHHPNPRPELDYCAQVAAHIISEIIILHHTNIKLSVAHIVNRCPWYIYVCKQ